MGPSGTRSRGAWRGAVAVAALAALVAAACGPKEEAVRALEAGRSASGGLVGDQDLAVDEAAGTDGAVDAAGTVDSGLTAGAPGEVAKPRATTTTVRRAAGGGGTTEGGGATEGVAAAPAAVQGETQGVTDTTIRIGAHLPLSISGLDLRSIAPVDKLIKAYWEARNRRGGIHGRKVEMVLADDGYNPSKAIEACKQLVAEKVFFVFGYAGADQMVACGQYALERGYPYLSIGTSEQGLIGRPGYFALSLTKSQEARLAARYIAKKLDGTKVNVALLRMNTPNTDGIRAAFLDEAKKLGVKVVVDDAVDKDPNPAQMQSECIKMRQNNVKVVYVYVSGLVQYQGALACSTQLYKPQWVATSNGGNCALEAPFGGAENDGCIQFATSHQADAVDHPLEQQACAEWAETYPNEACPEENSIAGPVGIWGLLDMFRAALEHTGRELTSQTLVDKMATLQYDNGFTNPLDFGGTQIGGHGELVWRSNASANKIVEIDSQWKSDW